MPVTLLQLLAYFLLFIISFLRFAIFYYACTPCCLVQFFNICIPRPLLLYGCIICAIRPDCLWWFLVGINYFFHFSLLLTFLFNKQRVPLKVEQLLKAIIYVIIYSYGNVFLLHNDKKLAF